ncbi:hypothetical protein M5X02_30725 [Paenibacillus alvei]|uniref:hypothetical protein n=1 Tax=Paenibacillus alvei TaxID=44250 RepID=UPI000288EE70|nr:hypothetical protein [Paenibacillus alvei]EJW13954.1 hypothetical protein PAV_141p00600 [Paenibacillus alvei DSM 29]MCY9545002.1 hypothetical protein [Paenibacillus alvei]MCY9707683.1 hypothetical protein [Paenibacillus alvei]MEC0082804.1 hypothetical protein [Paenibacillus alvei]
MKEQETSDYAKFATDKFEIRFVIAGKSMLGKRAHYVINMYPDEQYDNEVAMPMMVLHNHLKEDPKWSELFEDGKHS